jgi:methionyl-tRNA synthetase
MPASTERLWKQLGQHGNIRDERIEYVNGHPVFRAIEPGTELGKPEPIFPRLDKTITLAKLEELAEADRDRGKPSVGALREAPLQANHAKADGHGDQLKEKSKTVESENIKPTEVVTTEAAATPATTPSASPAPQPPSPESQVPNPAPPAPVVETPKITIDDFAKVELRAGEIKTAEAIPGAKKLLKLTVDIGTEVRQICAGIAEYYAPETLVGRKVVVVTNLLPRKMRGIESNGMIVAASVGEQGRPVLATFGEDVPNGTKLR